MRANGGAGKGDQAGGGDDGPGERVFGRRGGGKVILALALALVLVLFVTQNTEQVRIDFVVASATVPLVWALIGAAVLGLAVGLLLGRPGRRRRKRRS